ncbi:MAG TPA: ABC transporter ATP-binding protein [Pyrinomonadaceae bacterium]|jgi:lipopolysaccharide transport system ATP-binding protein
MKPIIKVEGLGKRYRIGAQQSPYGSLRETLAGAVRAPLKLFRRNANGAPPTFWAVKDVSFEVQPGEVVGIIGRNGAGKSTLLKLLSRITEPTTGRIELYGRVGSLLEVGTGFHPELSGRENIYLNGAILGMARTEIARKFDEIVAFAEMGKFVDTPVKHYSSGMYLRLAFAVAAHLEPEILIVDEVLAVGDVRFQRKCLDKMQDVSQEGRTVLFVSHNMPAVARLCKRAILLHEGQVLQDAAAPRVVSAYLGFGLEATGAREWPNAERAPGDNVVKLRAVRVRGEDGEVTDVVDVRKPVSIEIEYDVLQPGKRLSPAIICNNEEGVCVFSSGGTSAQFIDSQDPHFVGTYASTCAVPGNLFAEGALTITVSVNSILDGNVTHVVERDAVRFQVVDSLEDDNSARGLYGGPMLGVIRPRLQWTNKPLLRASLDSVGLPTDTRAGVS